MEMDIQNALWKLHALGDSSVLGEEYRAAVKLAAEVLNNVRNLADMGAGEDLAEVSAVVRNLAEQASTVEDQSMQIHTLEQDNARRAQLLAELLKHAERQDVELNPTGVEYDEPILYGLAREWATPATPADSAPPAIKIVQPGGLSNQLIATIKAAVTSSAVAHTCDWLISEGYASDSAHARELVDSALNT